MINAPQHFGSFHGEPIKQKKRMKSGKGWITGGSLMIREAVHDSEQLHKRRATKIKVLKVNVSASLSPSHDSYCRGRLEGTTLTAPVELLN